MITRFQPCHVGLTHTQLLRQLRLTQPTFGAVPQDAHSHVVRELRPFPLCTISWVLETLAVQLLSGTPARTAHSPSSNLCRANRTMRSNPRRSARASGPTAAITNSSAIRR